MSDDLDLDLYDIERRTRHGDYGVGGEETLALVARVRELEARAEVMRNNSNLQQRTIEEQSERIERLRRAALDGLDRLRSDVIKADGAR